MPAIIERNADPSEALGWVERSPEDFRDDAEYLAQHKADLRKQYPDEWIAVFNKEVVAHSRNSRELLRELKKRGLENRSPLVDFLSTKRNTLN
jgi:hypothetical protein